MRETRSLGGHSINLPVYIILLYLLKHLVDVALPYEPSIDLSVPCITSKYVPQTRTVINTLIVLYHLLNGRMPGRMWCTAYTVYL